MPQPTLWRTCRVLANRTRLAILGLLVKESSQTVSAVALSLQLSLPVASQYLRALEARGLLVSRRVGRRVEYRLNVAASASAHPLVGPLRSAFQRTTSPIEMIFKLATGFTHPRRIEILRVLTAETRTLAEVQTDTRISVAALQRHLRKLEARGFVVCRKGIYSVTDPPNAFGQALARLAAE